MLPALSLINLELVLAGSDGDIIYLLQLFQSRLAVPTQHHLLMFTACRHEPLYSMIIIANLKVSLKTKVL